jgi:acyl carrier protein
VAPIDIDMSKLSLEVSFRDDFGTDSLEGMELVRALEQAFGVERLPTSLSP